MKANDYKSGKVAKMIGGSHETLRFYHKNNIFTPKKKGQNPYDLYSDHDMACLYSLRSYKTLGLPLKDCGEAIKNQNQDSLSRNLDQMYLLLEKNIQWNKLLEKHLSRIKDWTNQIETSFHQMTMAQMPETYIFTIDSINIELSIDEKKILHQLATFTPVVIPINIIDPTYLENTYMESDYAMGIFAEDFEYFTKYYPLKSLIEKGVFTKIPTGEWLTTIIRINIAQRYDKTALQYIINYLSTKKIQVCTKLYGSIIAVNYQHPNEDDLFDYYIAWIPCVDKRKL